MSELQDAVERLKSFVHSHATWKEDHINESGHIVQVPYSDEIARGLRVSDIRTVLIALILDLK